MLAFKRSCNIVDRKHVLMRLIVGNEHSPIALVAGITSNNWTSVTTWDVKSFSAAEKPCVKVITSLIDLFADGRE